VSRGSRAEGAAFSRGWGWLALAAGVCLLPLLPGLSGSRIFYVRDLSLYFWGRYLWLRRSWLSGEWPLWDPYVGAGQAAFSDALHQMFFPPAIAARLIGGEVLGFNLWVALPFPLAAAGAWGFLSRRFSPAGAALGAIGYTLCGPVISSGNFPNLSWAVAALPWVLWATDRLVRVCSPRHVATLTAAVAMQFLAGEPVTTFTTLLLVLAYAAAFAGETRRANLVTSVRVMTRVGVAIALGLALSAIQVGPMTAAALMAQRAEAIGQDAWSLRPTALLETVWLHLFGNYYEAASLTEVPWMPLMYTGREPFFFSIYFGLPLLALATYGLAGNGPRRWRLFWVAAGFVSLVISFGSYTPLYPILRDHVPPFGSFRFPVKYIVVAAMALAAGVAAGWDSLSREVSRTVAVRDRRERRARIVTLTGLATATALIAVFALACAYFPAQIAPLLRSFADRLGGSDNAPEAFLLRTAPEGARSIVVVATLALALLAVASRTTRVSWPMARYGLFAVITVDLLVRASGINPTFEPAHVAEPAWLSHTRSDPHARFYVGGKFGGTLDGMDHDASRWYASAPGLNGSGSRAALATQALFYPSGWKAREMLSYDLPVLWPEPFGFASKHFYESSPWSRDRFLDRTGVRYRILPKRRAMGRTAITPIPLFTESFLIDWGEDVAARASIVPMARVLPTYQLQVKELFKDDWNGREIVLVEYEPEIAGTAGPAVTPSASVVRDQANHVVVEAGVGSGGGYLVLLDSYSEDWRVTVDGAPADMVRANGLFRGVRLPEGLHTVEFSYRPPSLMWGSAISFAALLVALALFFAPDRRRAWRSVNLAP